jgi:hypothetical protein
MNDKLGWALAGLSFVAGYVGWGWRGLVLALTVVVFWMLLQFSRTMRVLRAAAGAPVGQVASAVMLHSKLKVGMRLADVIRLAGSIGQKQGDEPETYRWQDVGGVIVEVEWARGRCARWTLLRPEDPRSRKEETPPGRGLLNRS